MEQGRKSRSKGFITSPKVWNEGSTPDEELERNLKKKKNKPLMYLFLWAP